MSFSKRIENAITRKTNDKIILMILLICMCIVMCGIFCSCSITGVSKENESDKEDVEFDIVSDEKLPSELKKIINERKEKLFKTTFEDGGDLYIVVGYGKQPTGGYSIKVNELYETNNGLYIKTEFMGPSKSETVTQAVSYPYIVVKTKYSDKPVVFG